MSILNMNDDELRRLLAGSPSDDKYNTEANSFWFGIFLLTVSLAAFVYQFIAMYQVNIRRKIFNKDFMAQFDEEHKAAFDGQSAPVGGWPDNGNGYYAEKLSYGEWYVFNNW